MTDVLDDVREHYRATGLTERLKAALTAFGPEDQRLTPQQLSVLDQFHTRGVAATDELARLVGLTSDMSVLDVGSGLGGPARYLAATYGCRVTGVDLSGPLWMYSLPSATSTSCSSMVGFTKYSAPQVRGPTGPARHNSSDGESQGHELTGFGTAQHAFW